MFLADVGLTAGRQSDKINKYPGSLACIAHRIFGWPARTRLGRRLLALLSIAPRDNRYHRSRGFHQGQKGLVAQGTPDIWLVFRRRSASFLTISSRFAPLCWLLKNAIRIMRVV